MLTRLVVKNFKSIADQPGIDIEVRPLTILVGPNGSGKSSILESLAFLAQNIEGQPTRLETGGDLLAYPHISAIAHQGDPTRWISVGLYTTKTKQGCSFSYRPSTGEVRMQVLGGKGEPLVEAGTSGDMRLGYTLYFSHSGEGWDEPSLNTPGGRWGTGPMPADLCRVLDSQVFRSYRPSDLGNRVALKLDRAADTVRECAAALKENVFLMRGLRGEVPAQGSIGVDARWVGTKCENLLVLLARVTSPAYEDAHRLIDRWAREFGLSKVWAGVTASNVLSGQYVDPVFNVPLNLSVASHGARQALGMIVQMFWSKPGSIVMVEEPELSLHPEAQDKLPKLFAAAVEEQKQVVIATHSHYLLLALTEAVKAGLSSDDIAVYEVTKERESGTMARRLPVTKRGYIRDWVSSFAEVDRQLLRRRVGRATPMRAK